jgi:protein-disulfide isomerase
MWDQEIVRASAFRLAVPVGAHDHIMGNPGALVTLVEYGDYECAACLHAEPIVRRVLQRFGSRLRFAFRHFPQTSIHPQATLAAQSAEAAAAQGKFWEMHNLLFRHQKNLTETQMTHLALHVGLEIYRFNAELALGTHADRVRADFTGGVKSGVTSTPAFFVNGARVVQPCSLDVLSMAVAMAIQRHARHTL